MITTVTVPVFEHNFECVFCYLQDVDARPVSISPKRFSPSFGTDMQT
ncbi:hypothetical protein CAter282_0396 [Collimonas arenae]|uniref:Uncharacterized protein n=1 Tax=Collimonas arenae TaxID=279058 RepID=A0A127PL25_9BURK|nr:hypothetical protein CAter10_0420 [Collimonas arenae]AMP08212.1 hypothetical protein CAter282_0396 [Collimonas arenae]